MEEKKFEELIKGIYDSLTDEQKERAKDCKTPEELWKFAGKEGVELPDELLDEVAGGCGERTAGTPNRRTARTPIVRTIRTPAMSGGLYNSIFRTIYNSNSDFSEDDGSGRNNNDPPIVLL